MGWGVVIKFRSSVQMRVSRCKSLIERFIWLVSIVAGINEVSFKYDFVTRIPCSGY